MLITSGSQRVNELSTVTFFSESDAFFETFLNPWDYGNVLRRGGGRSYLLHLCLRIRF